MRRSEIIQSKIETYITWSEIQNVIYDFRKYKLSIDLLKKGNEENMGSNYHCIEFLEISNLHVLEHYENFDYKESLYFNDFDFAKRKKYCINILCNNESIVEKNANIYLEIGECALYLKAKEIKINNEVFNLD